MPLRPGDTLLNGQYQVLRLLGRGGFGFVYLARDTLLDEELAIKELIPGLMGGGAADGGPPDETLKRFLAEAKATKRLRHERIVHTYAVFQEAGHYYIAMEYMAGGSLEDRLEQARRSPGPPTPELPTWHSRGGSRTAPTPGADPALRTTRTPGADPALRTTRTPGADPALRTTRTPGADPSISGANSASPAGGRLPLAEALRMAAEVCEGLAYAHSRGVVHCDLKPSNILFDQQGAARVADFGIAHISTEMLSRSWHTPAGFVAGTLPYMSPEQTEGVRDDPRLDLYALGAVLYRALTGRLYLSFDERDTPLAQADNVYLIRTQPPLPPSTYDARIPAWVDDAVLRALHKDPAQRFPTASALAAALAPAPPATAPPGTAEPEIAQPGTAEHKPGVADDAYVWGQLGKPTQHPPRLRLPRWFWHTMAVALLLLSAGAALLLGAGGDRPGISPALESPTAPQAPVAASSATSTPPDLSGLEAQQATAPARSSPSATRPAATSTLPAPSTQAAVAPPQPSPAVTPASRSPTPSAPPASPPVASPPPASPPPASPTPASPTPASPTPASPTPLPAPVLVEPAAGAALQGTVRFAWQWAGPPLGGDLFFDLRIASRQEELAGIEPRGAVAPTQDTAVEVLVDLAPAVQQYGPGDYYWTVVVVRKAGAEALSAGVRLAGDWGERRRFTFGGGGPEPEPTKPEPQPTTKPTPAP
jgi:serine/threonine protein kinase